MPHVTPLSKLCESEYISSFHHFAIINLLTPGQTRQKPTIINTILCLRPRLCQLGRGHYEFCFNCLILRIFARIRDLLKIMWDKLLLLIFFSICFHGVVSLLSVWLIIFKNICISTTNLLHTYLIIFRLERSQRQQNTFSPSGKRQKVETGASFSTKLCYCAPLTTHFLTKNDFI